MGAITQGKRKKTARESAEKFGVTERTIRNWLAQPRAEFLAEATRRRKQALALKEQGLTRRQVAEEMEISFEAAKALLKRARAQERA
jgi:transposase